MSKNYNMPAPSKELCEEMIEHYSAKCLILLKALNSLTKIGVGDDGLLSDLSERYIEARDMLSFFLAESLKD